jgi:hypothetical protein
LYASVLAVLLSTIIPPFLLKFTIGYYRQVQETCGVGQRGNAIAPRFGVRQAVGRFGGISKEEREAKLVYSNKESGISLYSDAVRLELGFAAASN